MEISILTLVCLCAAWWWDVGELSLRTKIVFTLLFCVSFALLLVPDGARVFIVAQCLLIVIVGGATFGIDWLMKRH